MSEVVYGGQGLVPRTAGFERRAWEKREVIENFSSGDLTGDLILGEGVGLSFAKHPEWAYERNANVMVVAGSGQGKTRSVVLPNLINHLPANYVVTDTKGELQRATADGFRADGYEVQVLDTIKPGRSCCINPFAYIEKESDIPLFADLLLDAVNEGQLFSNGKNGDFWDNTARMLFEAIIGLCFSMEELDGKFSSEWKGGSEPRYLNLEHILKLVDMVAVGDDEGKTIVSPLDILVNQLSAGFIGKSVFHDGMHVRFASKNDSFGVRQYRAFKSAANRTLKSIVISLHASLYKLRTPEMKRLFDHDELDIMNIDCGKRVIYLAMSDNVSTNAFVGRLVFKLLLNKALLKADSQPNGKLAKPVLFLCDEFANLGKLGDFERAISITRSRNIAFLMCIQSINQLGWVYGADRARIIMDNCDTLAFLGSGSTYESARYFSDLCGDAVFGTSRVGVEGTEKDITDRLMSASDISRLPREDCIIKISGVGPYLTKKYDVRRHPNAEKFLRLPD